MRAVLDVNVLVSALLSRTSSPALVLVAWLEGRFEMIVSPVLVRELERVLAYPKLRARVTAGEAERFLAWLAGSATMVSDPSGPPPIHARDPDDDYLLALAAAQSAILVSGDQDLLALAAPDRPIHAPASFLTLLR